MTLAFQTVFKEEVETVCLDTHHGTHVKKVSEGLFLSYKKCFAKKDQVADLEKALQRILTICFCKNQMHQPQKS